MHALGALLAATATSEPSPTPTVDPELVTPGPWGFVVIALLALVVIVLIWDMLRRIRRARYREEVGKQLDAERQAEEAGSGPAPGEDPVDTDPGARPAADGEPGGRSS